MSVSTPLPPQAATVPPPSAAPRFVTGSTLRHILVMTGTSALGLIAFFCRWLAPLFVFFGTLFVCNAACNTLGRPHYATALNWGRATLGTVPFVMLGSYWGAEGVLLGHMAGGIAFGLAAVVVVRRLIARLEAG